jgi:predicted solute-binding protein
MAKKNHKQIIEELPIIKERVVNEQIYKRVAEKFNLSETQVKDFWENYCFYLSEKVCGLQDFIIYYLGKIKPYKHKSKK